MFTVLIILGVVGTITVYQYTGTQIILPVFSLPWAWLLTTWCIASFFFITEANVLTLITVIAYIALPYTFFILNKLNISAFLSMSITTLCMIQYSTSYKPHWIVLGGYMVYILFVVSYSTKVFYNS